MRGLCNLGNTCFFNTAIQALVHCAPLTTHLFSIDPYEGQCEITKEYQKIAHELFLKDRDTVPVNPSALLEAFRARYPRFANLDQHDAQEVVLLLIDVFECSLGRDLVTNIFNGEETQETLWSEGSSTVKNSFTTIILDVKEPCKLEALMDERVEPIYIQNYKDDAGKTHGTATIKRTVSRWPTITCFSFSMYDRKFPIELPVTFEGRRLFSAIIHAGVQRGGHYALLVRRHGTWYIKDDETVRELPTIEIFRGEFYMAFYRL